MTDAMIDNKHARVEPVRRSKMQKLLQNTTFWRGVIAIITFIILWEIGSRFGDITGTEWVLPFVGKIPPPSSVFVAFLEVIPKAGYWNSWLQSFLRVMSGFLAAMILGIPFGLSLIHI